MIRNVAVWGYHVFADQLPPPVVEAYSKSYSQWKGDNKCAGLPDEWVPGILREALANIYPDKAGVPEAIRYIVCGERFAFSVIFPSNFHNDVMAKAAQLQGANV